MKLEKKGYHNIRMNWDKIISALKIPLKVLLPSVWLFSGFLVLANENVLSSLGMLQWKNENSFVFGFLFLISSCLITVYAFWYIKDKISNLFFKLRLKTETAKALSKMNDAELEIIIYLYKSHGYTNYLDYANPLVQGLLARKFIYMGNNQVVSIEYDNKVPARFSLQPFVAQAIDKEVDKLQSDIKKLTTKLNNTSNHKKKEKIQLKLSHLEQSWENYKSY